jgi:hypothetical protein
MLAKSIFSSVGAGFLGPSIGLAFSCLRGPVHITNIIPDSAVHLNLTTPDSPAFNVTCISECRAVVSTCKEERYLILGLCLLNFFQAFIIVFIAVCAVCRRSPTPAKSVTREVCHGSFLANR